MILSLISFALSAVGIAIMETLMHHHSSSIWKDCESESFWGKESWRRKYKHGDSAFGEKFLFSSSFLVFLTDGYHLVKLIMILLLCVSILTFSIDVYSLGKFTLCFAVYYIVYTGFFTLFYESLLRKK